MNKYIYILFILVLIFIIFSNSRENFSNETHLKRNCNYIQSWNTVFK